ncbi:hypothetical protein B0T16DRAFT_171131 [Cercophora newfieldiana]|uniref:Uncharacterized protein n=1 Tax=Cercophora newfieldiana TaxID=92897 RepID=A0AA39Y741_9PEZI|nr:hypothetical protein B0T16DRAFT_171131 [Cercophora newfieldiana]
MDRSRISFIDTVCFIELAHSAAFNDKLRGKLREAERNYDHYKKEFKAADREASGLKEVLKERNSQLTQANIAIDRLSEQGKRRDGELRSVNDQLLLTEGELQTAKEAISAWESVWAEQQSYYDDAIAKLNRALEEQKAKTAALHNYLASQTKEPAAYEATSDQVFKTALQTLSQNTNNLAIAIHQPRNRATVLIPLDRTGFLRRNVNGTGFAGEREWRCFIRSVCLETVFEGFFHWPLGFGVFGKEGEKRDSQSFENSLAGDVGARADFFGLMLRMLENPTDTRIGDATLGGEALMRSVNAFKANSDRVEANLAQKLQACGGRSLNTADKALISTIVQDSGRLALRMGAQRASVLLQRPSHRDLVILGEYFSHDAGTIQDGTAAQVDLVLDACMVRIGDGRDDLTTIKIISKGSVTVFA